MSSFQPTSNADPKAIVAVLWHERQCNIVIDTTKDRRGIQEILEQAKKIIRGMIRQDRRHIRRPR